MLKSWGWGRFTVAIQSTEGPKARLIDPVVRGKLEIG